MATESYSNLTTLLQYYGNGKRLGAHIPFNFGLLSTERNNIIPYIDEIIGEWLEHLPENTVANWVVSVSIV